MPEGIKEWKMWQQVYNNLVTEHSDARHLHKRVMSEEIVENALRYIQVQDDYGIYPAKSYIVAIIYAVMIQRTYGDDLYESLNDPDLLYGQDEFFIPYSQDKANYDAILERLAMIPNWLNGGWAPKTVEYFHLECTQAGIESINGKTA